MLNLFNSMPIHERRITVATVVTITRMLFIPFIIWALCKQAWGFACALFLMASLTDVLDGALARLRNERTLLGACLDPIADKLLLCSVFLTLALITCPLIYVPWWFVGMIVVKECVMLTGALLVHKKRGVLVVRPTALGKFATFAQIAVITYFFLYYFVVGTRGPYGVKILVIITIIIGAALGQYIKAGIAQYRISG